MTTKSIVLGIVVLLIIVFGVFFVINRNIGTVATDQAAAPIDQTKVQGQEVKVGTGLEAVEGSQVSVLYVGKLADGTVFDSSAMHNNEPMTFTLGDNRLIPGFQIGVNGMKEGGERVIQIPSSLGYGAEEKKDASGKVIIPANSTLIFDIQLVKVTHPVATAPATSATTSTSTAVQAPVTATTSAPSAPETGTTTKKVQ